MNNLEFKQEVENTLMQLKYAHKVGKNQIALRCKFCGDSRKDPRKTRFYVLINKESDEPILYNCFNCGVSGILTPSVLRTFDVNNLQLNSSLITFNKSSISKIQKRLKIKDNHFMYKIPNKIKDTTLNRSKLEYVRNRLGIEFSIKELIDLKAVFSLEDFLSVNKIDNINTSITRAHRLNDDYIGFLSARNEYIIYRDITNKNKLRYDKYVIVPDLDNTRKFYTIPNNVNILSTEPININMAEGVFDILGVYYHIKNKKLDNEIYVAICDSGYTSVIKYFIGLGLIGKTINVNIFSDSDHDPYFYRNMVKELSPWVNKISLYYNEISKDFGVPKNEIKLIAKRID